MEYPEDDEREGEGELDELLVGPPPPELEEELNAGGCLLLRPGGPGPEPGPLAGAGPRQARQTT